MLKGLIILTLCILLNKHTFSLFLTWKIACALDFWRFYNCDINFYFYFYFLKGCYLVNKTRNLLDGSSSIRRITELKLHVMSDMGKDDRKQKQSTLTRLNCLGVEQYNLNNQYYFTNCFCCQNIGLFTYCLWINKDGLFPPQKQWYKLKSIIEDKDKYPAAKIIHNKMQPHDMWAHSNYSWWNHMVNSMV